MSEVKIENLIRMHSSLFGRQEQYNKSQQRIAIAVGNDFPAPLFKVGGNTPEDFEEDIALRIKVLSVEERKKELCKEEGKGRRKQTGKRKDKERKHIRIKLIKMRKIAKKERRRENMEVRRKKRKSFLKIRN